MKNTRKMLVLVLTLFVFACSLLSNPPQPTPAESQTAPSQPEIESSEVTTVDETPSDIQPIPDITILDYPQATAVDLAIGSDGTLYLAIGQNDGIYLLRSTDGGANFTDPVHVNPGAPAYSMRITRPSVAVGENGKVIVSWSQNTGANLSNFWYATSVDGGNSFASPQVLGPSDQFRAYLLTMAYVETGNPLAAWLLDGKLMLARSTDGGGTFEEAQLLDDRVCDCCQPNPLPTSGGTLYLAYRNLEFDVEDKAIRDIYVMTSLDNGATFGAPVRVSDAPWYIDACPTVGPAIGIFGDKIFVSWMDGRYDGGQSFSRADIWFAVSSDGGNSFSPNRRVNPIEGQFNTYPTMAVGEDGRIHIAWQAEEGHNSYLYYTSSTDSGATFSQPLLVAYSDGSNGRGRFTNSDLVLGPDGRIYLAWVDNLGIHLAVWQV